MRWSLAGSFAFVCVLCAFMASQPQVASGANILGVFVSPSISHLIVHMSIANALAEQGHNVTVLTSMKPTTVHPAINIITIPPSEEHIRAKDTLMKKMVTGKQNIIVMVYTFMTSNRILMDVQMSALKDERFTRLYDTPDTKFDAIIMGYFFNDFQLAVAAKFKAPVILSWMGPPMPMFDSYMGNPTEVAYVPGFEMSFKAGEVMNFFKRVSNFLGNASFMFVTLLINFIMERRYNEFFTNEESFPSFQEMRQNVSLTFCNSHSISEGPIRPLVPGIVEIGGIQIKSKPDPLPKDIADFMNSTNGAILFSLGSNLKGDHMKPETMKIIFDTLASLKQNVVWKWDDLENTPGKAKNILYKKWLPQDDILAHPNLKLFITHAGKGGVAESQFHGVPMVALPVFADQHTNADKIEEAGYGLQVNILTLDGATLKKAVLEVLENPKYRNNVKKISQLYRDRPMTAQQTAVYWTEYVIRHHGAKHIQSPLVFMNILQSTSVDVIVFLVVVLYVVWRVVKLIFKTLWKLVKKTKNVKTKNKKD